MLLRGDCIERMKTLPDKSIDLFLCDLPYGCLTGGAGKEKAKRKEKGNEGVVAGCDWDIPIDLPQFWEQVKRLAKNDHTPVLHFCNARFGFELYNSNPDWFRYDLVWNKMRGVSFLTANKMPMRSHENIYVFAKKGATYYRKDMEGDYEKWKVGKNAKNAVRSVQYGTDRVSSEGGDGRRCVLSVVDVRGGNFFKGKHPTQKPEELYEWLITRYSKPGDTLLDPTFGSGNSGRVAVQLNRNYIGIEKDPTFFESFNTPAQHRPLGPSSSSSSCPHPPSARDGTLAPPERRESSSSEHPPSSASP